MILRFRCGCSVVLSLFWNLWMFADLHSEPLRAMLTNTSSNSHQACASFAATLVQRYSRNPVVFAWEIGNEHNLLTDLNCSGQTWGCSPPLGTPAVRTAADSSSSHDYLQFQSAIAAIIRQRDVLSRAISSGHSLPRPSAFHLMQAFPRADWTADTMDQVATAGDALPCCVANTAWQFHSMLVLLTGACDWVSVHFYADDTSRFGFTGAQLLQNVCAASNATGKLLYVGEFGDDKSKGAASPVTDAVLAFLSQTSCSALVRPATIWIWGKPVCRRAQINCYSILTATAELWQQNGTYALYPDDAGECFCLFLRCHCQALHRQLLSAVDRHVVQSMLQLNQKP
jgi:hypothetical protein